MRGRIAAPDSNKQAKAGAMAFTRDKRAMAMTGGMAMGLSLLGVAAVASTVIPPLLSDRIPLRSAVADARDAGRK